MRFTSGCIESVSQQMVNYTAREVEEGRGRRGTYFWKFQLLGEPNHLINGG